MSGGSPSLLFRTRVPRPDTWDGAFADRDVGAEELCALLAGARVAPSADNLQPWRFVAVRSRETRRRIARAVPGAVGRAVEAAPLAVVACGVRSIVNRIRSEQPFVMVDVPIAVTHMLLLSAELGLSAAWSFDVDEDRLREVLGIPDPVRAIAVLALGWPGAR